MSQHPNHLSHRSPDAASLDIQSHAQGLTITLPSAQNARRSFRQSLIFANLALMGATCVLVLPLLGGDAESAAAVWWICALMLVLVNGGWFAVRYQSFQRLKGSGRIELTPYLFRMDEWFVPTHLIQSVEYSPSNLNGYEGLRILWSDGSDVRAYILQLFITVPAYQKVADSINAYLSDQKQSIADARCSDPWLAMTSLIPPHKGRFPMTVQEGAVVIQPAPPWRSIVTGVMLCVGMVGLGAYLIPTFFSNPERLQMMFQVMLPTIDFKDIVTTLIDLVFFAGIVFSAFLCLCLPFYLVWRLIDDWVPTRFVLSPEKLSVKKGKSVQVFPWHEIQAFKLIEKIVYASRNRTVYHDVVMLHQEQEHSLMTLVNEADRIQEVAWLKDIFERVWRWRRAR